MREEQWGHSSIEKRFQHSPLILLLHGSDQPQNSPLSGRLCLQRPPGSLSQRITHSSLLNPVPVVNYARAVTRSADQKTLYCPHSVKSSFSDFVQSAFHIAMLPSEPPLLAYARYHGLATDHLAVELDLSAQFDTQGDLPNSHSKTASLIPLPKEAKLRLKKSELQLLAASIRPDPPPSWDDVLPDRHRTRDLKLETPLLPADHKEHLRCFTEGPNLDLKDLGVLPDMQSRQSDAKMSQEKLQAPKEDLMYLQRILQDPYTPEGYQQVINDALPGYIRVSSLILSAHQCPS